MKIFLSYQQTWVKEKDLNYNLNLFREGLKKLWHDSFIYFLDDDSSAPATYIIEKAKKEIKNSDLVIAFINHDIRSEWQLLELGITEGFWKNILLLVNNKLKDKYYLTYWLNSKLIYFNSLEDINFKKILL